MAYKLLIFIRTNLIVHSIIPVSLQFVTNGISKMVFGALLFMCWSQFYYFNKHRVHDTEIKRTTKFTLKNFSDEHLYPENDSKIARTIKLTTVNADLMDLEDIIRMTKNC